MIRFSIWTAVSTAAQAEDDKDSLHEQEVKSRAAALAKGWHEVAVYTVPGESRTRYVNLRDAEEDIPPLRAMLEDAKAGRFHILVLWDYNRLRDLLDPVAKTLANYGVQIYSINQPAEPLTPAEFNPYASDSESMVRGMSQIISRWQIADLRRKYRFGVKARVDRGLPALKIPYGYIKPKGFESEPKVIPVPHPLHSAVVIEIKKLFLQNKSIQHIAAHLTARYPTPTGIPSWSRQTIRKILRNPFYAGKVFFGARLTVHDSRLNIKRLKTNPAPYTKDGAHKPLYPYTDYLAILAEFERRRESPRLSVFPWSGMLRCGSCGQRLRRKFDTKYNRGRYVCLHCGKVNIHHDELQEKFAPALQDSLRHASPSAQDESASSPPSILPVLHELDRSRKRVQQAYESEVYSLQEAEEKIKGIDAKIDALKNTELAQAKQHAQRQQFQTTFTESRAILEDLPQWIRQADPKKANALLLRLFRHITVNPDNSLHPELRQ